MAAESVRVELHDTFYRDSFGKVVLIIISVIVAMVIVIALSIYLYFDVPPPITFNVNDEFRVLKPVPVDEPYVTSADVLQFVATALTRSFILDFIHYNDQLKTAPKYFTNEGWLIFLNHLNNYASQNNLVANKLFVTGAPAGTPSILNQGVLLGRYSWWVQIPFTLYYASYNRSSSQTLTLQVLVVRVPTTNNLDGLGINNILVVTKGGQAGTQ